MAWRGMMICVFDVESVPDVDLLREVYKYDGDDLGVCNLAFREQEKKTGSSFLPLCFHKIVSLACIIANDSMLPIEFKNFASNVDAEHRERAILDEFTELLNDSSPRLVSFNGRAFDMPLIALRVMKYNIPFVSYHETQNRGKSKWENYKQRYSDKFHTDLLDVLSNHFTARGMKLDHVCKMLGIVGKYENKGDEVHVMYYGGHKGDGDMRAIDFYCQSDVLNTYLLLLKFELSRGNIVMQNYVSILEAIKEKIPDSAPYMSAFVDSIDNEMHRSSSSLRR